MAESPRCLTTFQSARRFRRTRGPASPLLRVRSCQVMMIIINVGIPQGQLAVLGTVAADEDVINAVIEETIGAMTK